VNAARAALGLLALLSLAACGGPPGEGEEGTSRIGSYQLRTLPEGLEIRSIPDQQPWLNRLFGWLHPRIAQLGLPAVLITADHVIEWSGLGIERSRPLAEVRSVAVSKRLPRGPEAKTQLLDRSWRVLLLDGEGRTLRGFGFGREADARAFSVALARACGVAASADRIEAADDDEAG